MIFAGVRTLSQRNQMFRVNRAAFAAMHYGVET